MDLLFFFFKEEEEGGGGGDRTKEPLLTFNVLNPTFGAPRKRASFSIRGRLLFNPFLGLFFVLGV